MNYRPILSPSCSIVQCMKILGGDSTKTSGQSVALDSVTVGPNRLRTIIRTHSLAFYFILAFLITWVVMIPYTLSVWGIIPGNWVIVEYLSSFGPTLAAITLVGTIEGKPGLQGLWKRVRDWRIGWPWFLLIFVAMPFLVLVGSIVQPGALADFLGMSAQTVVQYPLYFLIVAVVGGPLGEEIGWRGFALPRLQPRYGPLWGTLTLGVLWACWHLELFLTPIQGGGPGTGWSTFFTNFPIFFVFVVALAIVMTWVFNHTRGSLFASIYVHNDVDAPTYALIPPFPAVGRTTLILGAAIGYGALAILILIRTYGRLGYQPSK